MEQLSTAQSELIRDCLYMAKSLLYSCPVIKNPYPETINKELLEKTLDQITGTHLFSEEWSRK